MAYTATAKGVKEDVVLAGPEATTSFDFSVEASAGLSAEETPAEGIDFVDGEGATRAAFAPPFPYDTSFETTGARPKRSILLRQVSSWPRTALFSRAERVSSTPPYSIATPGAFQTICLNHVQQHRVAEAEARLDVAYVLHVPSASKRLRFSPRSLSGEGA